MKPLFFASIAPTCTGSDGTDRLSNPDPFPARRLVVVVTVLLHCSHRCQGIMRQRRLKLLRPVEGASKAKPPAELGLVPS
ncbi:unnamed protein product [Protopolystoma xenopodis]|uniref:Uncharacterized protein n=1 Tax=Protopolystoma xenopodis TaxID=117903 RepID=A0A3S5B010_9PLAT|nr:unnamed protein product [Protopolystoma xenopodis]